MITKIIARYVIGFEVDDHIIYKDGEVVYEDDHIVFVGHDYPGYVDEVIDAGRAIVSPGFIDLDALADIDHAILDTWIGLDAEKDLNWSEAYFSKHRHEVLTPDEIAQGRLFALSQLLMNGITTSMPIAAETYREWAETYDEFTKVVEIAGNLGLRMYLGPSYRSGITVTRADGRIDVLWDEQRGEQGINDALRIIEEFDGSHNGLIKGCLLPCRIQTCTPDLLRRTKQAAESLGCLVRLHACQEPEEVKLLRKWYNKTSLELLEELDFLGPRTLIPHCTHIAERSTPKDELRLLSDTGTTVIHCPMAYARYGTALKSFQRFRQAGVNMAMGTDTFPPDMIKQMDYGSNTGKYMDGGSIVSTPAEYYRAATLGGAKALGRDDLGKLAPRAKADIIIIDLNMLRTGPLNDPIRTLLYNASGNNVRTVIINGHIVVKDGKILGLDEEALLDQCQAIFDKMLASYPERSFRQRPIAELFPQSYKISSRDVKSAN